MKISEIVEAYKSRGLRESEITRLIAFECGVSRERIVAHRDEEFCGDIDRLLEKLERRAQGFPLQYLLGNVEFYGRKFAIREGVFIPRWETEGLVELAIVLIKERRLGLVAEIGVGAGVIAITLALETGAIVLGTDVSDVAVEVSWQNARLHDCVERVDFKVGPYLEPFENVFDEIEMIVSNPPYVRTGVQVPPELTFEPPKALYAGADGLDFYREFFRRYGTSGKIVLMEIGEDQGEALKKMTGGVVLQDLSGKDRYLVVEGRNTW